MQGEESLYRLLDRTNLLEDRHEVLCQCKTYVGFLASKQTPLKKFNETISDFVGFFSFLKQGLFDWHCHMLV